MNTGTSLYAGFVVFSVLGFMAHELNVDVKAVVASGPGLAFITYPKAVALMPGAHVWAVLFFAMITLLGLGTQFVCVEAFVTAVVDVFPKYLRYGRRREWFILTTCLVSYLIGLAMVTRVCPTTQCPLITMLTYCAGWYLRIQSVRLLRRFGTVIVVVLFPPDVCHRMAIL